MSILARVSVHPTQFPDRVRSELIASLRARRLNHKFLFDTARQAQQWRGLHELYSPWRLDPDCVRTHDRCFDRVTVQITSGNVHVVGLACGDGRKDARLLWILGAPGRRMVYTPCDVSLPLLLAARQNALGIVSDSDCLPLLCDLAAADDLGSILDAQSAGTERVVTCFGTLHNFEPQEIAARLAGLVRARDSLLVSANLAPGAVYGDGLRRILPQYDNQPTREWLMRVLFVLGFHREDGELRWQLESDPAGTELQRVAAWFHLRRDREITLDQEQFLMQQGESIRLFFSYRYTPDLLHSVFRQHGLETSNQWIAGSGEEGLFLCRRQ